MNMNCCCKLALAAFLAAAMLPAPGADETCTDEGVCTLPGSGDAGNIYKVLSPVGRNAIQPIRQAPRLDTLNGKTVAVVGGSFMAYVTHPEIKRLILRHYPKAKVILLNEIGSAGPWPGPGVIRKQKEEFTANLKRMKVDAVISGNGGCGLCTPKEMGSCIAAEHLGIPAVMIAAPGFTDQAKSAARTAGVAIPRVAEYPGAFASHTREELLKNTREVLWPQIVKALTAPLSDAEKAAEQGVGAPDAVVCTGTLDEINLHFARNGWSDGLPIIPPTPARVAEFLKFTDRAPDEVFAVIPPGSRQVTARLVAVNGVMSGCPAEFMPILMAFAQAMTKGDFRRTLASTHAWTPYCWVNGPIARQLELDHTQGEISSQRNAAIGRFLNLAMLNLGGYYIKQNRMGTFGYLMPWCLAEDEKAALSFGWSPYHVQQGLALNDNALTAASALAWGNNLAPATSDAQKIMELMAQDAVEKEQFALGSGTPFVYRTMLVTEYVARDLAKKYTSKEALEEALIATARRPLAERAYVNYYGNPGSAFDPATYPMARHVQKLRTAENGAATAVPPWLAWTGLQTLETVPVMTRGKTAILLTGDANRNKTMCLPGGGYATIKIELPKNWDKLTAALGYAPLSSFYLTDSRPAAPRQTTTRPAVRSGGGQNGENQHYRQMQNGQNRQSGRGNRRQQQRRRGN